MCFESNFYSLFAIWTFVTLKFHDIIYKHLQRDKRNILLQDIRKKREWRRERESVCVSWKFNVRLLVFDFVDSLRNEDAIRFFRLKRFPFKISFFIFSFLHNKRDLFYIITMLFRNNFYIEQGFFHFFYNFFSFQSKLDFNEVIWIYI